MVMGYEMGKKRGKSLVLGYFMVGWSGAMSIDCVTAKRQKKRQKSQNAAFSHLLDGPKTFSNIETCYTGSCQL